MPISNTKTRKNKSKSKSISSISKSKKNKSRKVRKNTLKKRKSRRNKSKKRRGGSRINDPELEKYKIKNEDLTLEHYNEAFGKENGELFFNQNPKPYSLYKVPIEGEIENRIKCADSNIKKDSKLFNYHFINTDECKRYGGVYCESRSNNKYQKLLNMSNRWSNAYDPMIQKCLNKTKRLSPTSVTEIPEIPEVGFNEEKINEPTVFNLRKLDDELPLAGGVRPPTPPMRLQGTPVMNSIMDRVNPFWISSQGYSSYINEVFRIILDIDKIDALHRENELGEFFRMLVINRFEIAIQDDPSNWDIIFRHMRSGETGRIVRELREINHMASDVYQENIIRIMRLNPNRTV